MLGYVKIAIHLLLALFAAAQALAEETFARRFSDGQPPAILAHRSAEMGGYPENTLAWIEFAIGRGVDVIHINPQITADDRYILMHDPTLNRLTDVEGVYPEGPPGGPTRAERGGRDFVRDYTLGEIQKLRIGGGERGGTHPIPSLDEALDFIDGRILVLLGLKSYEVESLAGVLAGRNAQNLLLFELYYSGTDQSKLRELAEVSGFGVSVTPYGSSDFLADLEEVHAQLGPSLQSYWIKGRGLTPELVKRLEELDLVVFYSGWSGPEDFALVEDGDAEPWKSVLKRGFAAATDHPELLLEVLGR